MRQIELKYGGECKRCGAYLAEGDPAMYEKSMGIFCVGHEPTETEEIRSFRTMKAEKRAELEDCEAGCTCNPVTGPWPCPRCADIEESF